MSSPNGRALRRLVALAILSGVVLIALFCVVEQAQIRHRAVETLTAFKTDPHTEPDALASGRVRPTIAVLGLDDADTSADSALERGLRHYAKVSAPPPGEITRLGEGRMQAYFFVQDAQALGFAGDETYLFYTDVSFASDVVRSAALVMGLVFLIVAALLYRSGRATIRLLDEKDAAMRDFFAGASHELKTPLMAITSYADGLSRGIVDESTACAVIDKECARMNGLVADILAFSKLDGGMVRLQKLDTDVREILYDALQSIEAESARRGIALEPELPAPLSLCCDETLLYSVFSNILTNSVRYARGTIRLSAERTDDALCVMLANDGPAIDADEAARLFDRFHVGSGGQTGLGLALAREYARLHGGDVSVRSAEGWTIFCVRLPLAG